MIQQFFLQLVRLGIGHSASRDALTEAVDWNEIQTLARAQGLAAVVLDGLNQLKDKREESAVKLPEKQFLTQWIGDVLQNYEYRYEQYRRTIAEMAGFYNSHGCKMMVLKGFSCSLNWPKPAHRPVGDIDIWQFGEYKKADALLESEKGIKVDSSHHHHTVLHWRNFMVENHYDFINVHHHRSNVELEKELKRLGEDDSHFVELFGEKVYTPSPNLHALFLLKHTMNDFTSFSMTLRQLLDWAFHVQRYGEVIEWDWLKGVVEKYNMTDFYNCVNAICVEDLGFDVSLFHGVQMNPLLKSKVLDDILYPKFTVNEPDQLIPRLKYKYNRWKGNAWKHQMCYKESMWSAFWWGIWNHILKPKSI